MAILASEKWSVILLLLLLMLSGCPKVEESWYVYCVLNEWAFRK